MSTAPPEAILTNSAILHAKSSCVDDRRLTMTQDTAGVVRSHSLSAAVADGTITEAAAFCGLSPEDIERLAQPAMDGGHPNARVLVRLRNACGDARRVMTASELRLWAHGKPWESADRRGIIIDGVCYASRDIRDVTAVAS